MRRLIGLQRRARDRVRARLVGGAVTAPDVEVPAGWPEPGIVEVEAPVDELAGVVLDVEPVR